MTSAMVASSDTATRLVITHLLERCDIVVTATRVPDGLPELMSSVDIAVVDEHLVDLELLNGVRRDGGTLLVVITASRRPEDRGRLLNAGADVVLASPVNPSQVTDLVARPRCMLR